MERPPSPGPGSLTSSIARVVGAYAIFASLWILLSDRALELFLPDRESYAAFSTVKGFAFVAVTATLLWLLLRVEFGRRARAEEALAETTAQLLRAQRAEAVGSLASGIAHDLNNVLTPVLMMAPLLRDSLTSPEDRSLVDTLEQCAKRGADILKQLLTFARGAPGARVALPLRHLVREMAKLAQETFPRDIEIRTEIASDLWSAEGDVTQIHQVLMNLCINARDAMPHGGRLVLRAGNVTLDGTELPETPPRVGPHVRLAVIDTGSGISDADRDRIFDPFFTTKEQGKGTGLGLSTVLGIVRGHGGAIHVDSVPGTGSTFAVYLPAGTGYGEEADEAIEEVLPGDGSVVLLVEDELAVRHGLVRALVSGGYAVVEASNGQEGLEAWQRHADVIRLVVSDLVLPVLSGPAMVAQLRARGVTVPILALSGLATDRAADVPDGFSASLAKPLTPAQLLRAVSALLPPRSSDASAPTEPPVANAAPALRR